MKKKIRHKTKIHNMKYKATIFIYIYTHYINEGNKKIKGNQKARLKAKRILLKDK